MEIEYCSIFWKVSPKEYAKIRNSTLLANFLLIVAILSLILVYNLGLFTSFISVILYISFATIAMMTKLYSESLKKKILLKHHE
jgi:hypothetical protein